MGNNQNERLPFQATHCQQRGSQEAAVARAVAAVCRACGDSTAAALGLWEGWDVRGRQGLGGGVSPGQFLVD